MMRITESKQGGAALVVGLILLTAITLMAIASMNSAALDLLMAGNEQFRSRAFAAAETGIEHGYRKKTLDSGADFTSTKATTGSGSDAFQYKITRPNAGRVEGAPSGVSDGTYGTIHFRVESTGESERGAQSVNVQELYEIVKKSDELGKIDACADADLDSFGTC